MSIVVRPQTCAHGFAEPDRLCPYCSRAKAPGQALLAYQRALAAAQARGSR